MEKVSLNVDKFSNLSCESLQLLQSVACWLILWLMFFFSLFRLVFCTVSSCPVNKVRTLHRIYVIVLLIYSVLLLWFSEIASIMTATCNCNIPIDPEWSQLVSCYFLECLQIPVSWQWVRAKGSNSGYELLISEITPSPHMTLTATRSMYCHPDPPSNLLLVAFLAPSWFSIEH